MISKWYITIFLFTLQAIPKDTLDLCQIINDDLAFTVSKYPKRFLALGTLPMQVCFLNTLSIFNYPSQPSLPWFGNGATIYFQLTIFVRPEHQSFALL